MSAVLLIRLAHRVLSSGASANDRSFILFLFDRMIMHSYAVTLLLPLWKGWAADANFPHFTVNT